MTAWRPASGPAAARRRAALLERVRGHFAATGALEVDTPALSAFANTDPALASFEVTAGDGRRLYLATSPESCMKRLLAAGYPDIFSIARVFRDAESGARHLPEFTLIEWYRLGHELDAIVADTVALVAACLEQPGLGAKLVRLDYADAFARYAGIDVFSAPADALADAAGADAELRRVLGPDRDAWLDLLLETRVVPALDPAAPTVLAHFPADKAALARLCPADPRVADRFELFLGGLELANGYVELTDPAEQRRRFDAELAWRAARGLPALPRDELLLAALDAGLPQCAGVALGAERLQMVYDATREITDVVTFGAHTDDG
ncbi:MAG: EF-P lysine aminoacylase EpmA [Woeseiaceae bacterium]|nr:EF-P lysine aminoacylase EpmA [Woeseiaceae bacterium]